MSLFTWNTRTVVLSAGEVLRHKGTCEYSNKKDYVVEKWKRILIGLLSPQWSDLEGMNLMYQLLHLLFLLSAQHARVRTLGSCPLLPTTGTRPGLLARENKNADDTELAWVSSSDGVSLKLTALHPDLRRSSAKWALASSALYTSRLTQKSLREKKNHDCECKALGRVFPIFSARQWRTILSCAHSAQEMFFKWPDSCQKEVTSFPILNPDTIYGPPFTSAGVDQQPCQIRFIVLIFILHFVARTLEFNLWDKDKFVL